VPSGNSSITRVRHSSSLEQKMRSPRETMLHRASVTALQ
jgi:hypothetical protein